MGTKKQMIHFLDIHKSNSNYYMKQMKNKFLIITTLLTIYLSTYNTSAQNKKSYILEDISFRKYLDLVKSQNMEYAAEKMNITIAQAAVEAAKVFNDPNLSFDWIEDSEHNTRSGYGFESELIKTVDFTGKRRARVDLTRSESDLTNAMVDDYFRKLRAEATIAFIEAMTHKKLFDVKLNSYQTMRKLSEADSIRFKLGSIMEIDAIQSKLETGILLNELVYAESEMKNKLIQLSFYTGYTVTDTLLTPSTSLNEIYKDFSLNNLLALGIDNRADLRAAVESKNVSRKNLILTKKERNTEPDIKLGVYNSFIPGVTTKTTTIVTGIAVPLKFSNIYRGDLKMAEAQVRQTDEFYNLAELQVKNEIMQAWELYQNYCKQVENFDNGLLMDAEVVRKGKIYSYQRGETSLLEVLNAQRTYNEIQTSYYEAIFNQLSSLVELEKTAGIWDIEF
jgi:outer membrane protein, heavy metal efflux system